MLVPLTVICAVALAGCVSSSPREAGDIPRPQGPPTRSARIVGQQLDGLASAFAPISERVNFVVAAERLHMLDVDDGTVGTAAAIRRQNVIAEVRRYRAIIRSARASVDRVSVGARVATTQQMLIRLIDVRMAALRSLEAALRGEQHGNDAATNVQRDQWSASWDQSLGLARRVTNDGQKLRSQLGLPPASEDAFR